ncbi:MAG TPA: ATP-binding cassette domain-containing protein [Armatimonadota bacterium]|nr:ATP-binding cassette domain-containing protein [Armatimonadota bacterium]
MAIVETMALTRCFGDIVAVDDLSISVNAGELFGVLGPNGAGKSTVLKMLTTLLPPTSGSARVVEFDIKRQAAQVRRVIGYVPQLLSADGTLTGYENLLIFAKLYDIPRREREGRIHDALAFMGLRDAAHHTVNTYSGGMIRRLEIAQSTLHRPRVLFLDEPTVGLDPAARHVVWEMITQLRDTYGTTIILTTHLMEEADTLCTRVAIMHRGQIAALDTPHALKASLGKEGATLDDVFIHVAGDTLDVGCGYHDTERTRRTTRRLG